MKSSGVNPNEGKQPNMALIFGLTYLLGLFLSVAMMTISIHQMGVMAIFDGLQPDGKIHPDLQSFLETYGSRFRSFKHGALHGFIASVTIALPIIGMVSMFERRSGKYVFIHWGYWAITLLLMGGLICAAM